ncbi:hypothetical protein D3C86_2088260 [compost metagenome]
MIEAWPVPKSSISISMPSAFSAAIVSAISSSRSSRKMDSSSSNDMTPGGMRMARRSEIRLWSRSRREETLTEIFGTTRPARRQASKSA